MLELPWGNGGGVGGVEEGFGEEEGRERLGDGAPGVLVRCAAVEARVWGC